MISRQIKSTGNDGLISSDLNFLDSKKNKLNNNSKQGFQWKVDITHIHQNFPFALQSRVNPHFHSQHTTKLQKGQQTNHKCTDSFREFESSRREDKMCADIHNEVLPLTLQSEIKQHQIISLIKGNC